MRPTDATETMVFDKLAPFLPRDAARELAGVHFGKHRGAAWSAVPLDYLQWLVRQDMDEDTLFTARAEIARRQSGRS